jgi:two-component system sensor histidine kinase KdpD
MRKLRREGLAAGDVGIAVVVATLTVLALDFFLVEPRHTLTIAQTQDGLALAVVLLVAVAIGILIVAARRRTHVAEARAADAAARQRESALLATTASSLLGDAGEWRPPAVEAAGARLELAASPAPGEGESAVRVPSREASCWLYVDAARWSTDDAKRIAEPLADVIDVELSRRRLAETAADVEAARRADVAKTALLHAVSHDLRSPLTAITTATAALNSGVLEDGDRAELLAGLESEAARLERLINDLLTLSRIEAGAESPNVDWCDVRDVVAIAAEHVRAIHGEHPIEIDLPDDLPLVRADPVQLQRVFANLIENAVKFSPPDEPVQVSGGGQDNVVVTVSDGGQGIPPSQRLKVFEPFFRNGDGAAGSGLGLAICKGFVEANGGRIKVKPRRGPGTAFSVSFPAAPQPSELP